MKAKRILLATLIATGLLLLSSLTLPANSPASQEVLAAPIHQTHPMTPATNPGGSSSLANSPVSCPEPSGECLASINWGGYAICAEPSTYCADLEASPAPAPGPVTYVAGTWEVPRITTSFGTSCSDQENTWYDASVWVGIDGLFTQTVGQTGTSSDCFYGQTSYYAWYEFYPEPSTTISTIEVKPGDSMTASVTCTPVSGGADCSTTIKDVTNGESYTQPSTFAPGALLESAEWIEESAYYYGFLALTPVTPVSFTNTMATINDVSRPISGWGTSVYWLVMVTYDFPYVPFYQQSSMVKAEPSSLTRDGDFVSTWYSSGP